MSYAGKPQSLIVPLFPLPNVVLFPRAVLPLHIFEQRYKAMTIDALRGEKLIAMALLKPGWEQNYYSRPEIEPVVCVGKIVAHEKLADGTYNFLLQGAQRARLEQETGDRPYRIGNLRPIEETNILEIDLADQRARLAELFSEAPWSQVAIGKQFRELVAGELTTAEVADLVAFNFLEDVPLKQSLLAEGDVRKRVDRIIQAVHEVRPASALVASSRASDPSMN